MNSDETPSTPDFAATVATVLRGMTQHDTQPVPVFAPDASECLRTVPKMVKVNRSLGDAMLGPNGCRGLHTTEQIVEHGADQIIQGLVKLWHDEPTRIRQKVADCASKAVRERVSNTAIEWADDDARIQNAIQQQQAEFTSPQFRAALIAIVTARLQGQQTPFDSLGRLLLQDLSEHMISILRDVAGTAPSSEAAFVACPLDIKEILEDIERAYHRDRDRELTAAFGAGLKSTAALNQPTNTIPPNSETHGQVAAAIPRQQASEAAADDNDEQTPAEPEHVFRPDGDGYDITFHDSGHVSAVRCKGLHQIHRLIQTPMVPVLMAELEGASFVDPHSRQGIADQATLKDVAAKLREAKSELECATASQDRDTIDVAHCRQEVEKWEGELVKLLGLRGQVRDLNNPYDKKRPKIWGTIDTAKQRLRDSGHSELADHLDGSIESERAWFVYVPKLNPIPNWKTEKKDASLRP